jgi:AcrR family transcriptional regulator
MSAPRRRARAGAADLDAFASGGYGATGMAEVADRAGVTRAVLYDHFPSKKALFLGILREQNAAFLGHIGARITGEGSPAERMRETTSAVFEFAERHPNAWRMLFVNATHGDDEIDAAWNEIAGSRNHAVVLLLAEDFRARGIDPDSRRAEVIVEMLVGALTGAVEWRRKHRALSRAEAVDAAMDLLWAGLSQKSQD